MLQGSLLGCCLIGGQHSQHGAEPAVQCTDPCPEAAKGKGEQPSLQPSAYHLGNPKARSRSIQEWVAENFKKQSKRLTIRRTSQGKLKARIWVVAAWVWEPSQARARRRTLMARQEADGTMKYSWSNFPADTRWDRLAYMQAQRYWIERTFEDGKSELGMAQYEVRGWRGWHHHMALVSLAMLFVVKERISFKDVAPLLSARDIVELLEFYLPRRGTKEEEVLDDLVQRHQRRRQAAISHEKRNRRTKSET